PTGYPTSFTYYARAVSLDLLLAFSSPPGIAKHLLSKRAAMRSVRTSQQHGYGGLSLILKHKLSVSARAEAKLPTDCKIWLEMKRPALRPRYRGGKLRRSLI